MEKTLNIDERIRKAEEIYYKRKLNTELPKYNMATVNVVNKRNFKLLKRMVVQFVICTVIYCCYYFFIQKNDTIYYQKIDNTIKSILSYDITVNEYREKLENFFHKKNVQEVIENVVEQQNNVIEETLSVSEETQGNQSTNTTTEEVSSISQMEEDANIVKSNNSFIIPVVGIVTSRFGIRNPTTETVPKYHTGIDIGANTGTVIVASMDGVVIQVSSQGDYRKSYKNRKW